MRTLLFFLILLISSQGAEAAQVSPEFVTTLHNFSERKLTLRSRLSCHVYVDIGDGDFDAVPCREFDERYGGIDPAQKHLPDSVRFTPVQETGGRYRVPGQRIYTSVHGTSSNYLGFALVAEDNKTVEQYGVSDGEIVNAPAILENVAFYSVKEQRVPFTVSDANGLSTSEFIGLFPMGSVMGGTFPRAKDGSYLSSGIGRTVNGKHLLGIASWEFVRIGESSPDYRFDLEFSLEMPTGETVKTLNEYSTARGLLAPVVFNTDVKLADHAPAGRFRFDARADYEVGEERNSLYGFSGELSFRCDADRVLHMQLTMTDKNGKIYEISSTDRCYAGAVEMKFDAPFFDGKETVMIPVIVGGADGTSPDRFSKEGFSLYARTLRRDDRSTFVITARPRLEFPDFPNACLSRAEAMKIAYGYRFDFGFKGRLRHYSVEHGTYVYANQAPEGSKYATRAEFQADVNKMAGKEALNDPNAEFYFFYDTTAYMGCLSEVVVLVHCDGRVEHYTRSLGCI